MNQKYIEYIADELSERDLLEQLAEEASELSQAALKLIRAVKYSENITPVKEEEAVENLVAEFNDVIVSWNALVMSQHAIRVEIATQALNREKTKKLERWAKRLGYEEK